MHEQYVLFHSLEIYVFGRRIETRMSTFIKRKLKKSDGQTNIDKYRESLHKMLYIIMLQQKFDITSFKS